MAMSVSRISAPRRYILNNLVRPKWPTRCDKPPPPSVSVGDRQGTNEQTQRQTEGNRASLCGGCFKSLLTFRILFPNDETPQHTCITSVRGINEFVGYASSKEILTGNICLQDILLAANSSNVVVMFV